MDDILQRLLEVEREAARIVAAAEAEAQRLQDAGRQQLNAERQRQRAALAEEVRRLISQRVEAADAERRTALAQAEERLSRRAAAFTQAVQSRAGRVLAEVAFPVGVDQP